MQFEFEVESIRIIKATQRSIANQRSMADIRPNGHDINQMRTAIRCDRHLCADHSQRCRSATVK